MSSKLGQMTVKSINEVKIAISGKSGCGNTTVSRLVSETLGLTFINFTFRSLAEERGLDLKEILALAAKDDSWDREVDTRQVDLARTSGGCVLGSRLAIWMLTEADLKVFLTATPETRAHRIHQREGGDIRAIMDFTEARDRQDNERYLRIYQINNDDFSFADMVIDTGNITPSEITERIIATVKQKLKLD